MRVGSSSSVALASSEEEWVFALLADTAVEEDGEMKNLNTYPYEWLCGTTATMEDHNRVTLCKRCVWANEMHTTNPPESKGMF